MRVAEYVLVHQAYAYVESPFSIAELFETQADLLSKPNIFGGLSRSNDAKWRLFARKGFFFLSQFERPWNLLESSSYSHVIGGRGSRIANPDTNHNSH